MTIKQQIISFLQSHGEGIDDDELAKALNLRARQQANSRCRELEKEGLIIRRLVNGKIHNFWAGKIITETYKTKIPSELQDKQENWFWEGNVQSQVVRYLSLQNYQIRSVANTATHERGIDIVAEKDGKSLWVTVKGYPRGTERTNPKTQAVHWFKDVIFDIIKYRAIDKNVSLSVALPDFPRYHSLVNQISWFKPVANFTYYWVRENGEVIQE